MGAHHYSGTWHHNGTAAHGAPPNASVEMVPAHSAARGAADPTFEEWFGVNRSNNCAEADFSQFIRSTWECRKGLYRCPRPTWERFDAECNGTKAGCPRAKKKPAQRRRRRRGSANANGRVGT